MSSNTMKPFSLPRDGSTASFPTSEHQHSHRLFISRLLGRRPFTPPSPPSPHVPSVERSDSEAELNSETFNTGDKDQPKEEERLQVSVLISMPNPNSRRTFGSDAGSDISIKGVHALLGNGMN